MFFIDWLFPPRCLSCNLIGVWLCLPCQAKLNVSLRKEPEVQALEGIDTVFVANADHAYILAKILYGWKYKLWSDPAKLLQNIFAQAFCRTIGTTDNIMCVPVPVHAQKLRDRGFNQARELSQYLEQVSNLEVCDLLIRTRNTRSQVGLTREERGENLKLAFSLDVSIFVPAMRSRHIVLVDDILTTGTTLQECATVLREAGFEKIDALVLHRGTK